MANNENFLNEFAAAKPGDSVIYHTGKTLWYKCLEDDGTVRHRRYQAANEAWDMYASGRAALFQKVLGSAKQEDRHIQYIAIKRAA